MKVATNNLMRDYLSMILVIGVVILMYSCNNSGEANKQDDTTAVNVTNTNIVSRDRYYTVKLPADTIALLFTSNNVDSVVEMIYFDYSELGNEGYTLNVYGATKFASRVTPVYTLDTLGNGSELRYTGDNPPAYKQICTRGYLKGFWGLQTNSSTTIPRMDMTDIWLTPCLKPFTDTLTYVATPGKGVPYVCKKEWKTVVGLIHTNPSPPDGACYNLCDEPQVFPIKK